MTTIVIRTHMNFSAREVVDALVMMGYRIDNLVDADMEYSRGFSVIMHTTIRVVDMAPGDYSSPTRHTVWYDDMMRGDYDSISTNT